MSRGLGTRERTATRYKNGLHSLNSMVLAQEGVIRPLKWVKPPEINPATYTNLVYDKRGISTHRGKDALFNIQHRDDWIATWKMVKPKLFFSSHPGINLKWTRDLNIKSKTIQVPKENVSEFF